ncbi:hypothetical protein PSQ19_06015 [Devosia algicola]|uniref:Uncharacterized protein n=1 Tax=Devosia algicola TaxID=3026418 RepID=A0ABY7YQL9_9HYPH|nr:hypothetical protein [Devosia algicola]WDR03623.1 hypothetical protein PSQ19_06015 [Devosia algicola]
MLAQGARKPAKKRPQTFTPKPFVAPTRGWISATNLAAAPVGAAQILENWYPTTTGIKMRSGSRKHGTASTTEPLESLITYIGSATRKMFAAADGKIIELTAPASTTTVPTADVSGQTSNYYSFANFPTSGGNYMSVVNGTDDLQLYDGSAWASIDGSSTPAITAVTTSNLSHVNVYRNRQWFVEAGTMNAWYLPTDSIGGAASKVSLTGVFRKGGALLFTATWSFDAGLGPNEVIVFASTEGEFAVYNSDPALDDWGIIGLYDASPPLGKNAYLRVGGDLLVLTEIGLIPMSAIKQKDPAALALAAISRNIQPDWQAEVLERRTLPWEIVKWTSRNIAYVSCPVTAVETVTPPICFAVNLETGAWSKVTGWNTRCMALHDDSVYFGTNAGTLMQADITGTDDGELIYYTYVGHNDHLGRLGQDKTVLQARAIFRTKSAFTPQLSVTTDYQNNLPAYPNAATITDSPGEWDVGLWDVAKWDTGANYYTSQTYWVTIGISGFSHAPILQVVSGSTSAPSAELVVFEVLFEPGGVAV